MILYQYTNSINPGGDRGNFQSAVNFSAVPPWMRFQAFIQADRIITARHLSYRSIVFLWAAVYMNKFKGIIFAVKARAKLVRVAALVLSREGLGFRRYDNNLTIKDQSLRMDIQI